VAGSSAGRTPGTGLKVQVQHPLKVSYRERAIYAFRFICSLLTMEAVLHTMYVVAIKDTKAWEGDSPADLSMIGFWNLVIVWLKVSYSDVICDLF
jgi:D-alanyl-lipoteichoic acid acyltransferase DltB (MBOAT superfamily)